MNKSLLFLSILLIPGYLFSQEEQSARTTHLFSLEIVNNQVKENILIPKVNRGPGIELSYRFEKDKKNLNELMFAAGYSKLKTNLETDKGTYNISFNADYSWGKILLDGEKVKYYLGADVSYNWSVLEYPVWDESRAYWSSAISAGLYNRIKLIFNDKNTLISSLKMELAGICSRPEDIRLYAQEEWTFSNIILITNSGYTFTTIPDFFLCSLRNEYRIALNEDLCFSLNNSIIYSTISEINGESFQRIIISFGIGVGF